MADDIGIKRQEFPDSCALNLDITIIKQEIDEDAPAHNVEIWDCPNTVKKEGTYEIINGNQPPTVTNKDEFNQNNAENNNQFYLEISTNVYDASKQEQVKEEIVTCDICLKESDEEMCKQCVLGNAEGHVPGAILDRTVDKSLDNPKISIDNIDLKRHLQNSGETSSCDYKTSANKFFQTHVQSERNVYYCDMCDYKCINKSLLIRHIKKHPGEKQYKCDLCDYKCLKTFSLNKHVSAKHRNAKNYSCNLCHIKIVNKSNFLRHLRKHTGEKPYKCKLCDYTFTQSSNLKRHVKVKHTNVKSYSCSFCHRMSLTESEFKRHLRRHAVENAYEYDYTCSRTFSLYAKHTNEKIYLCDMCEFKSANKGNLCRHLRKHTGEKPFKCKLCDYMCSESGTLKRHLAAKHTNEKNYSCNLCEFKAVFKVHLNQHIRRHTGEKPFKCKLCDYTCSQGSNLKKHIRAKHTKEKNYSCNLCEYKSVTKSNLNLHLRKHTGEKPYKCKLCDYTCSQGGNLKKHVRAKHNDGKTYTCEFESVQENDSYHHTEESHTNVVSVITHIRKVVI